MAIGSIRRVAERGTAVRGAYPRGIEQIPKCPHCSAPGASLYRGLPDRLFAVPGEWAISCCSPCGVAWLDPRPAVADLAAIYQNYFTHDDIPRIRFARMRRKLREAIEASSFGETSRGRNSLWKWAGGFLARMETLKDRALLATMCLGRAKPNGCRPKLLDIGCGNGFFLARMRDAGWEVDGLELDPLAADVARRRYGLEVKTGAVVEAHFARASFDAITLHHVIEHLPDALSMLRECARLLAPRGRLVIATPNLESLGHSRFGPAWIHLDPPRHLRLFSRRSLRACCEGAGLKVIELRSSARAAYWTWIASEAIRRHGAYERKKPALRDRIRAANFVRAESQAMKTDKSAGEEIVLVASNSD